MNTLTWDDYQTIVVISAITIIISAIFEWKRLGREKQLEDERFNFLKVEVENQKNKIHDLELSIKTLEICCDSNFSEVQRTMDKLESQTKE